VVKKFVVFILVSLLLQSCTSAVKGRELAEGKKNFRDGEYKTAFHQLLPLASEGNPTAQYAVGYMYYYGYGVSLDAESGRFWMQKSADQKFPAAEKALQMLK
jgi:TPR repeat protein